MSSVIHIQVACGQFGVSIFRILWRCLLMGAWPVRSWISMLVWLLREYVLPSESVIIHRYLLRLGTTRAAAGGA